MTHLLPDLQYYFPENNYQQSFSIGAQHQVMDVDTMLSF